MSLLRKEKHTIIVHADYLIANHFVMAHMKTPNSNLYDLLGKNNLKKFSYVVVNEISH